MLSDLPGRVLRKTRHYLGRIGSAEVSIDIFRGDLDGLVMAEAEFDSDEAMSSYRAPDFAFREVTEDIRYTGGHLVKHGLPAEEHDFPTP